MLLLALLLDASTPDDELDFFERRVRPLLVERCGECHGADARPPRGGLRLDRPGGWREGGSLGPAVVPGDPEHSLLVRAVRREEENLAMPPGGPLPEEEVALLAEWVRRGAIAPEDDGGSAARGVDAEAAADHWSFQPVEDPPVPSVQDVDWPRNEVDHFLLAAMEHRGLRPVEDQEPGRRLRRLAFDLTGLPPRDEWLESFVADPSEERWRQIVEEMLAGTEHAERWARHWLDVVRFAESTGGGRSAVLPSAWRYRDWVVQRIHEDQPVDEFLRQQIAGDLMPEAAHDDGPRIATSMLQLGPKNLDDQDKQKLRLDVVDEQLDTLGRAVLGLSLGCARCHDHKFDPVRIEDYYGLAGVLWSTRTLLDANVSVPVTRALVDDEDSRRRRAELDARLAPLRAQREELQARRKALAGDASLQLDPAQLNGVVVDDTQATLVGEWTRSTSVAGYVGSGYIHDQAAGKGEKSARFEAALRPGRYEVRFAYTHGSNRCAELPLRVLHRDGEDVHRVDQRARAAGGFVSLGVFEFGERGAVEVSTAGTRAHVILDAVQFLPEGSEARRGPASGTAAEIAALEGELAELDRTIRELEERRPPEPAKVLSIEEADDAADLAVRLRGDPHRLGPVAPRAGIAILGGPSLVPADGGSGRRELADWWTDARHPLTARVQVNRAFAWLFGVGLVPSVDNFGLVGRPPTHPALLDWLTTRFVEDGWSLRSVIRRLVNSRAYQLSARDDAHAASLDPESLLRWRIPRRRMEAESLRDAMLALSGRLDRRVGGRTLPATLKDEFGYAYEGRRRGLYVPVLRNSSHDLFEIFDVANPNFSVGQRAQSVRASQASYLLNAPFVREQAEAIAGPLRSRDDPDGALRDFYRRALSREPTAGERSALLRHLGDREDSDAAWADVIQAILASVDFRFLN